jgi:MYXO-CTERM domain-containing protein
MTFQNRSTGPAALAVALGLALAPAPAAAWAIDHLQDQSDIGKNKVPHSGTSRVLVIPSRVGGVITNARLQALREYFAEEGGPGTFRDYWKTMSQGAYDPIPFLAEPVYFDDCPLSNKTVATCRIVLEDIFLLSSGEVSTTIQQLVARVRDEQNVDLSQFDVNGVVEGQPDGWIDGLILSTDLFDGLGLPLAAFEQEACLYSAPQISVPVDAGVDAGAVDGGSTDSGAMDGGATDSGAMDSGAMDSGAMDSGAMDSGAMDSGVMDAGSLDAGDAGDGGVPPIEFVPCEDIAVDGGTFGDRLGIGVVAFIPPDGHEFGHNLGFMDLYGHPADPIQRVITGLMGNPRSGLSAHSRLTIGWGESQEVTAEEEIVLAPVLEGGKILQFGVPPRYVLVENRSGFKHNATENDYPGLYMYSIDENELPDGRLGFLELQNGDLFLPNRPAPKLGNVDCIDDCYLNVNLPLGCRFVTPAEGNSCTIDDGVSRDVTHADPDVGHLGFYVEFVERDFEGNVTVRVHEGTVEDLASDDAGTPETDAGQQADAGPGPVEPGPCGCRETTTGGTPAIVALLLLGLLATRRRRA